MKFLILLLFFLTTQALAAEPSIWKRLDLKQVFKADSPNVAYDGSYYDLDTNWLLTAQSQVPGLNRLTLPTPDGKLMHFSLLPSVVIPSSLQTRFPNIRSYIGTELGKPHNKASITISPRGIRGMFKHNGQQTFVSPAYPNQNTALYISYYRKDAVQPTAEMPKHDYLLFDQISALNNLNRVPEPSGEQIHTFRLALSASGEYSQFHGGTVESVLAEYVTLITRINQILLSDLALQFQLVENTDQLIFLDSETDPFTNDDASADLDANQDITDDRIGNANYDIGHLLSTNGGGLAGVGALCFTGFKAQGYTGQFPNNGPGPTGEAFYIDLVAHELGHQLGASHSFNAEGSAACDTSQRSGSESFEPGSGSTIMAYAGICSDQNLQTFSDPYFHAGSIEVIRATVLNRLTFSNCGLSDNLVSNPISPTTPPSVTVSATEFSIPANTPFVMEGEGSDVDGDSLAYVWEQIDTNCSFQQDLDGSELCSRGSTANAEEMQMDNGFNPLFRSFNPGSEPIRYFPKLEDVLTDTVSFGEAYPTTDRTLTFRLTARDGNGGVNAVDATVNVVNTGEAFTLDFPSENNLFLGNSIQTLRWTTGQTEQATINCSNVDLWLDIEANNSFDILVIEGLENDGEADISMPSVDTDNARFMLKCSNSVFFAVNPTPFALTTASSIAPTIIDQIRVQFDEDNSYTIDLDDLIVTDPDDVYPQGFSLTTSPGNNYSLDDNTVTPDANLNGELQVGVSVNDGELDSNLFLMSLTVNPINDAPIANNDSISVAFESSNNIIDALVNDSDVDGDSLSIQNIDYNGSGTVSIENNQLVYSPGSGFSGTESFNYMLADPSGATASAQVTVEVAAAQSTPTPPSNNTNSSGGGGSLHGLLYWLSALVIFLRIACSRKRHA